MTVKNDDGLAWLGARGGQAGLPRASKWPALEGDKGALLSTGEEGGPCGGTSLLL